jgi:hypothetical protein
VGVSGTVLTFDQIPYLISGGLVGMCLIVLGAGLWLSADIRDEWRKLDRLEDIMTRCPDVPIASPQVPKAGDADSKNSRRLRMTGA